MATGAAIQKSYRVLSVLNAGVTLAIGIFAAMMIGQAASDIQEVRLRANAREALNVQTEALNGALDKYRMLAVMLGQHADIRAALDDPDVGRARATARLVGLSALGLSGALDVTFLRSDGTVLARATDNLNDMIVPEGALMTAAMQGRLGREVRVLDRGKRAYVFAARVWSGGKAAGLVAVYVDLDTIENNWSLIGNPILAVDRNGRVVMSNRAQWRLGPPPAFNKPINGAELAPGEQATEYFSTSRALPALNWTLTVLVDAAPARNAGTLWGALAFAVCAAVALVVQMLINRHFFNVQRERRDRTTALRLERLVRDRTRELLETNVSLEHEVSERKAAVELLRRTQTELIQTGKLAALGQMSTALSHELNQPLSAVKSYADNALTFLQRGRETEARDNIKRISELTDRMAEISRHLRNFARKPNPTFGSVPIVGVIEDALKVLASRIRNDNAEIETSLGDGSIWVRGGHVRLQQVVVNLVLNGLDAMAGQPVPRMKITVTQEEGAVRVTVRDHGPGIDPAAREQIFDPFFTTKGVGQGLGLGLSISYNIIKDFGGQLLADNDPEGGAVFVVSLEIGESAKVVAA